MLKDWSHTGGVAARLRCFLRDLAWTEVAPWLWRHETQDVEVCLDPSSRAFTPDFNRQAHAVRETWRRSQWHEYVNSGKHEVAALAEVRYSESRARRVREMAKKASRHRVAVLTGAFVSPLMFSKRHQAQPEDDKCPYCGASEASYEHVTWTCQQFPKSRPPRPEDPLLRRLGWPTEAASKTEEAILCHIEGVRNDVLNAGWARPRRANS